jgi:hypothetical protein
MREFCEEVQLKMEEDCFVEGLISDEATFHFSGKVNRQCSYRRNRATTCTDRAPAWLSESQRFLCGIPRDSSRPIFLHWSNCEWRLISGDAGRLVVTPTEYQLWLLRSISGRNYLPPPFSHKCTSASQSCSSTALDRTSCKWRQQPSPLATPIAGPCTMRFLSFGVR